MASDEPTKPDDARSDVSGDAPGAKDDDAVTRFLPEEEAALIAESNEHKAEANALFGSGRFDAALAAYDRAVAALPVYCHYALAVLHSNRAACYLKQEAWKEAVASATAAVDALDRDDHTGGESGRPKEEDKKEMKGPGPAEATAAATHTGEPAGAGEPVDEPADEEIVSVGARTAARPPAATASTTTTTAATTTPTPQDRHRIRAKALLRRARARVALGGWANLAGAEEDYRALAALPDGVLGAADRRLAAQQLRALPARTAAAKEAEMGEMMGKLKELGNGLLRPFGISTDNFQMVKDEKTGGYSMNFRPSGGS